MKIGDILIIYTLVEAVETDTDVEADDSELADSGDPGRLIFLRFLGRPFNFGARIFQKTK